MRLTFAIWLLCVSCWGATYYVAVTGNDAADGSASTPWRSIGKGVSNAVSGDTLWVLAGAYAEQVLTVSAGTQANPISIIGSNGPTSKQFKLLHPWVNLTGFALTGCDAASGGSIQIGASNVIVDSFIITNSAASVYGVVTLTLGDAIPDPYVRNIRILNSTFNGILNHNFSLWCIDSVVSNCTIKNCYMDAFRLWGSNNVIVGNTVSNLYVDGENHPDFIQTFGPDSYSVSNFITGNRILDSYAQPANLSDDNSAICHSWVFANNVFANIGGAANVGISNTIWVNNTFFRVAVSNPVETAINLMDQNLFHGGAAIVENNVFAYCGTTPDGPTYGYINNFTTNSTVDYNAVFPAKSAAYFTDVHGVNGGTPGFTATNSEDFTLTSDSALIGTAVVATDYAGPVDIAGTTRGAAWDIGAYEYTNAPAPATNVTYRVGTLRVQTMRQR